MLGITADANIGIQLLLELFPVRDNADEPTLALELPEGIEYHEEGVPIQTPKALVDEEEAALQAGGGADHV